MPVFAYVKKLLATGNSLDLRTAAKGIINTIREKMEIPVKMSKMQRSSRIQMWSSLRRMVGPLFSVFFLTIPVAAQTVKVLPIAEVIRNRPDYTAAHNGETISVTGVVTDGSHDVGSGNSLANLEDGSGGIALFGDHAVLPPGAFQRGDVLVARGELSQYRGM